MSIGRARRRVKTDKRIASLWITRAGVPRLGWCFEGVPHSWLGAASCRVRVPLRPA